MKTYTVAVLGATGAVGQEMINILQERNFPVKELIPLASARSAGNTLRFRGEDIVIREACDEAFEGVDIVLGAAENDIAKQFAPAIVKAGAVFVDNSSAFRMDPEVPLIVPEVNPQDVVGHKGIISNPNCSTIITCTAVKAFVKEVFAENAEVSESVARADGVKHTLLVNANRRPTLIAVKSVFGASDDKMLHYPISSVIILFLPGCRLRLSAEYARW